VFPTAHPSWAGALPSNAEGIRAALGKYRAVLLVSREAFKVYPRSDGPPVPPELVLIHLSASSADIGRTWPATLGLAADPRATLGAIADRLEAMPVRLTATTGEALPNDLAPPAIHASPIAAVGQPLVPSAAVHAVLTALPTDTPVVNEAITTGMAVRDLHRMSIDGRYYFARGGGLGWGMPAAVGVSLGLGREPVVAFVGDGSAMYSPQALWTAAKEQLPVLFVVVNNQQYLILKQALRGRAGPSASKGAYVGMEIASPAVDFVQLARSMGVAASTATDPESIEKAIVAATSGGGPHLLEIPIAAPA